MAMLARLILLALLGAAPALAAGPDDNARADLAPVKAMIEGGREVEAIDVLQSMLAFHTGDADILNLLGFANRRLGHYVVSRDFYVRALAANAFHLGAHEYKGELELIEGNEAAARDHLERLAVLCPEGCEELDDLREAFVEAGLEP